MVGPRVGDPDTSHAPCRPPLWKGAVQLEKVVPNVSLPWVQVVSDIILAPESHQVSHGGQGGENSHRFPQRRP